MPSDGLAPGGLPPGLTRGQSALSPAEPTSPTESEILAAAPPMPLEPCPTPAQPRRLACRSSPYRLPP